VNIVFIKCLIGMVYKLVVRGQVVIIPSTQYALISTGAASN
jgi:hypothetical protein